MQNLTRQQIIAVVLGILAVAGVLTLAVAQRNIKPMFVAPARDLSTAVPAPVWPKPMPAPNDTPVPASYSPPQQATPATLVAPAPPLTGRGLGIVEPEAPPAEAPPTYLQVVADQAPHSPRGDGQAGPSGGDWVAVPTLAPEQAEVIGAQAPHKVR